LGRNEINANGIYKFKIVFDAIKKMLCKKGKLKSKIGFKDKGIMNKISQKWNNLYPGAKQYFPVRAFGFILVPFLVGFVAHNRGVLGVTQFILLGISLIWPYIALLHAMLSSSSRDAEVRNLILDFLVFGFWIPISQFHPWVIISVLTMGSMGTMANGGIFLFLKGLLAHTIGIIISGIFVGFVFRFDTDPSEIIAWGVSLFLFIQIYAYLNNIGIKRLRSIKKELKSLSENLCESEEKYRHLIENANDIINIYNWKGDFKFVSPAAQKLSGYTSEEAYKMNYMDVVHPDYKEKATNFYMNQLKDKIEETYYEMPLVTKDGRTYWIGQILKMVENQNGEIEFYGIARDITERKKVDEESKKYELELKKAYENLNAVYSEMKEDLLLAKIIQDSILPRDIGSLNGMKFLIEYLPMIEIGGDIYDIYQADNGVIRIFLADATGHGIVASLVTMLIKSEYEKYKSADMNPFEIFDKLNETFFETYKQLKMFFTGIIVDIDTKSGKLIYSSAGHPEQYLIRGNELIELPTTGRAVGIWTGINCKTREVDFQKGDRLLFFTDGLFEEFNPDKEEFGEERVREAILGNIEKPTQDIIDTIIEDMIDFMDESEFNDDITIIGVE